MKSLRKTITFLLILSLLIGNAANLYPLAPASGLKETAALMTKAVEDQTPAFQPITGLLDDKTILVFGRFEGYGGLETYLRFLMPELLRRNRVKIVYVFLTEDPGEREKKIKLPYGNGSELIKYPLLVSPPAEKQPVDSDRYKLIKKLTASLGFKEQLRDWLLRTRFSKVLRRFPFLLEFYQHRDMPYLDQYLGIMRRHKVDLAVTHYAEWLESLFLAQAAQLADIPLIVHNHTENKTFEQQTAKQVAGLAYGIAGVNTGDIPQKLKWAFRFLPDGIDLDYFRPENARPIGRKIKYPGVLLPAHISPDKGQEDLLRVAAILKSKGCPVTAVFAGEKRDLQLCARLTETAKELGLIEGEHYIVTGPLSQKDLRDYYGACDLAVLPSYYEGLGRVLLEAQAMQRPVLAYDTGGTQEALHHGQTGYLLDKGDITGLAEKIEYLVKDARLCSELGRAGREYVKKNFSLAASVEDHEIYYHEILWRWARRRPYLERQLPAKRTKWLDSGGYLLFLTFAIGAIFFSTIPDVLAYVLALALQLPLASIISGEDDIHEQVAAEFTPEKVLREAIEGKTWELISGPSGKKLTQCRVYRCGGFIIHDPINTQAEKEIDQVLSDLGSVFVPTTKLHNVRFRGPDGHTISSGTVYVQDEVEPLVIFDQMPLGGRQMPIAGLLFYLFESNEEKAKQLIDQVFETMEEIWRCGYWVKDISILTNMGTRDGKMYYYDLRDFEQGDPENINDYFQRLRLNCLALLENLMLIWLTPYFRLKQRQLFLFYIRNRTKRQEAARKPAQPAGAELRQERIAAEVEKRLREKQLAEEISAKIVFGCIPLATLLRQTRDKLETIPSYWEDITPHASAAKDEDEFRVAIIDNCVYVVHGGLLHRYSKNYSHTDSFAFARGILVKEDRDDNIDVYSRPRGHTRQEKINNREIYHDIIVLDSGLAAAIAESGQFSGGTISTLQDPVLPEKTGSTFIPSHEIEEIWQISRHNVEKNLVHVSIEYFWKGVYLGSVFLEITPENVSINTCGLKYYVSESRMIREIFCRAFLVGGNICKELGWSPENAHTFYTISNEEWPLIDHAGWDAVVRPDDPKTKIIEKLGFTRTWAPVFDPEEYGDTYENRTCNLSEFVQKAKDNWFKWFYQDQIVSIQGKSAWRRQRPALQGKEQLVFAAISASARKIASELKAQSYFGRIYHFSVVEEAVELDMAV